MARTHQRQLPCKYKVWSYQFILYPRVMWPLKLTDIPSTVADKTDRLANFHQEGTAEIPIRCTGRNREEVESSGRG